MRLQAKKKTHPTPTTACSCSDFKKTSKIHSPIRKIWSLFAVSYKKMRVLLGLMLCLFSFFSLMPTTHCVPSSGFQSACKTSSIALTFEQFMYQYLSTPAQEGTFCTTLLSSWQDQQSVSYKGGKGKGKNASQWERFCIAQVHFAVLLAWHFCKKTYKDKCVQSEWQ